MNFRTFLMFAGSASVPGVLGGSGGKGEVYVYQDLCSSAPPGGYSKNFRDMVEVGITDILLTFWLPTGPVDSLIYWVQAAESDRLAAKKVLKDADARLIMSVGGSTFGGWWTMNAVEMAKKVVADAEKYNFDGVDYDLEGSSVGAWVTEVMKFVKATKDISSKLLVYIAPQPPYFSAEQRPDWDVACAYFDNRPDGSPVVDKILMQYYNNPICMRSTSTDAYPTLEGILKKGMEKCSVTEIFEKCTSVLKKSIPKQRMIVGRPAKPKEDAGLETTTLSLSLLNCEARKLGAGGVMLWKWRDSDMDMYRSLSKPCAGSMESGPDLRGPVSPIVSTLPTTTPTTISITTPPTTISITTPPTTISISTSPTTISIAPKTDSVISDEEVARLREEVFRNREEEHRKERESVRVAKERAEKEHVKQDQTVTNGDKPASSELNPLQHVAACKSMVIGKNPEWTANCHEMCQYFSNPAFCGKETPAEKYTECVLRSTAKGTCLKV